MLIYINSLIENKNRNVYGLIILSHFLFYISSNNFGLLEPSRQLRIEIKYNNHVDPSLEQNN